MPKTKYSPASGIPAKGPGKGAGKGDGWGGASKGTGKGGAKRAFTAASETRAQFGSERHPDMSPEAKQRRQKVKADRTARIEQLTAHLADLGLNAERQETQVTATIAALNRLDGMPKQKNENVNVETTWEEMIAESLKPKKESAPGG